MFRFERAGPPRIPIFLRDPLCPSWLNLDVPRKKKMRFTAAKAVKSMARAVIGSPPPVQREESVKRIKKEKHKATLGKLLADSDRS
jgi:hypothetical protein